MSTRTYRATVIYRGRGQVEQNRRAFYGTDRDDAIAKANHWATELGWSGLAEIETEEMGVVSC